MIPIHGRRALIAVAVAVVAMATMAGAHGLLERAEPRPGSRLRTSPPHVTVWFTERLEPDYSRVQVLNEAGERVDANDSRIAAADAKRLGVSLPPLTPGIYKVLWRVLSVDGHLTQGEFTFRVAP